MIPFLLELRMLDEMSLGTLVGSALIDLDNIDPDELAVFLHDNLEHCDMYVRISSTVTGDIETSYKLLNAGAYKLVVGETLANELVRSGVPAERLVIALDDPAEALPLIEEGQWGGVQVPPKDLMSVQSLAIAAEKNVQKAGRLLAVLVADAHAVYKNVGNAIPIISNDHLTCDLHGDAERISLADLMTEKLVTDRPDGLYTTVVTNTSQQLLGICYSSKSSIAEAIRTRTGVYESRKRGLWYKGQSSGATQQLLRIAFDCDYDTVQFVVRQKQPGFCHLNTMSCFGDVYGLSKLEDVVNDRKFAAPANSYTHRLFSEPGLLNAKIMEEAEELCTASTTAEIAWEAADLLYFLVTKLAQNNVTMDEVFSNLTAKSRRVTRRKGDAKPKWAAVEQQREQAAKARHEVHRPSAAVLAPLKVIEASGLKRDEVKCALKRPAQSSKAFDLAAPIVDEVRMRGDAALLEFTEKFDKVALDCPVLNAPFPAESMVIDDDVKRAIDLSIANVEKFHAAQLPDGDLVVETCPGVRCMRFARPIESVGLYVPGGSAILPSTAIMLGVPARVAGVKKIVFASPPRPDGTLAPEVVYVAHRVGATQIVLAGGAQAVAAMAYGTLTVVKCDKILGPGNQFVTAAKMIVSNDLRAAVSIDMPAGPSEVLVIADKFANKKYVVSDLLSQAEHGPDSQVILIAVGWDSDDTEELQAEVKRQAQLLPRYSIVCESLKHSSVLLVDTCENAVELSNQYAPEHLILQVEHASRLLPHISSAGSIFVGALSPEACGDYSSGTNHTLPTYGYAKQYSGVNTSSFLKYITSQEVTREGLDIIGPATIVLAEREGLSGHANAVRARLE